MRAQFLAGPCRLGTINSGHIWSAYNAHAKEYTAAFGYMEATAQEDRWLIARWAQRVQGRIIGPGHGPEHWVAYLHDLDLQVEGVDPVRGLVRIVRGQHPHVTYRWSSSVYLPAGPYGAVLAWYSLIYTPLQGLSGTLASLKDSLTPRGSLLIRFFVGDWVEGLPHAVASAHYWSPQELVSLPKHSGFSVPDVGRHQVAGTRDHGSISCRAMQKIFPVCARPR